MTTETVRSRLAVRKQRLLETLRILSEDGTIILAPKATCSNPQIPTENTPGSRPVVCAWEPRREPSCSASPTPFPQFFVIRSLSIRVLTLTLPPISNAGLN
jgi:hypothetical protein